MQRLTDDKIEAVKLAGVLHFRFASMHPFGDGNARISRMIMNHVLAENNSSSTEHKICRQGGITIGHWKKDKMRWFS